MNNIQQFALAPLPSWHFLHDSHRQLRWDGERVAVVNGDEIAAQFQCGDHFLVVTDADYFDGVSYWFYLLDQDGHLVDQVCTPDYFGFIEKITVEGPARLSFGFFGTNDRWSLTVAEAGQRSWAWPELLCRSIRFLCVKRRILLTCTKGEPWSLPTTP